MKTTIYTSIFKKALLLGVFCAIFFALYNTYARQVSMPAPVDIQREKAVLPSHQKKIVFAGGCFWCTEAEFNHIPGVLSAVSGYANSEAPMPRYGDVSAGTVKARESVEVVYDETLVTFPELLTMYWKHIDPTDTGGQFGDRGYQYQTAIYFTEDSQQVAAQKSKDMLAHSSLFGGKAIATEIVPLSSFYPAEEYHQDYKDKNPVRYRVYRKASGRDDFIEKYWKGAAVETFFRDFMKAVVMRAAETATSGVAAWQDFTQEKKLQRLTELSPLQREVTQNSSTEKPFENEYYNNEERGIYVDIVSGEPLYSSSDKFDSGTGWPSFVRPVSEGVVTYKDDSSIFSTRTEVRSTIAGSHLGHVFSDGPAERGGKRYCMNSAALRFVALSQMEKEGYGEYIKNVK